MRWTTQAWMALAIVENIDGADAAKDLAGE